MTVQTSPSPNPDTQAMLDSLRLAVAKTLDRKRRLGQYAVQWSDQAPVALGKDAPAELQPQQD